MAEAVEHIVDRTQTLTLARDVTDGSESQGQPAVVLKLKKPKNDKKVQWTSETIDNEHMDKKKSKCCCVFKKPRSSLDSSSDDDDDMDCNDCRGHVEKKKKTEGPESSGESGSLIAS